MFKSFCVFLFCIAFIVPSYATELICASDFEAAGIDEYFARYSFNVLQSKMQLQDEARQLVASSAVKEGCSYLLKIRLTDKLVDVRLMDLKSGKYVFENIYKIKSTDDLPSVFEHIANSLQLSEFAEDEKEEKGERKSNGGHLVSSAYSFLGNLGHIIGLHYRYLWDMKTLWIETSLGYGSNLSNREIIFDPSIRILYPFSGEGDTFYIGSGGGISVGEGIFVENALGYLKWDANRAMPLRIEITATAVFNEKKSIGGGLRIIMGITDFSRDFHKEIGEMRENPKTF